MQKITEYIFSISPKKLAIYLVLGPLVLFLAYTIVSITFRTISNPSNTSGTGFSVLLGILLLFLFALILIWLLWLRTVVCAVKEKQLGLSQKWFQIAYAILWFFVIFNLTAALIQSLLEKHASDYLHIIYASREVINFGGILIAYPIVCHYAARATMAKRSGNKATFVGAIPFTLLLIFGTVLGIPFVHSYFTVNTSTKSEVIIIYAIAIGLFTTILIIGFLAAITGMV